MAVTLVPSASAAFPDRQGAGTGLLVSLVPGGGGAAVRVAVGVGVGGAVGGGVWVRWMMNLTSPAGPGGPVRDGRVVVLVLHDGSGGEVGRVVYDPRDRSLSVANRVGSAAGGDAVVSGHHARVPGVVLRGGGG